jgi:hypothetical protein
MYLSMALLADVLDHQEAIHGQRTDGLTMTIYGAIMAGMTGVATGILNIVLSNVNYAADNISSQAIRGAMPWVFIGVETFCYLVIFLIFHSVLKGTLNENAEEEKLLRVKKTRLEEEYNRLNKQLNVVGTDEYIMSSAVKDYSYVKKDAIRFEFTNPEALYAYSEAELQILMDEMNE